MMDRRCQHVRVSGCLIASCMCGMRHASIGTSTLPIVIGNPSSYTAHDCVPEGFILDGRSSTLFMLSLEPPCTCAWHMHMQVVMWCTQAMQSHYEVTKAGVSMLLKQ